MKWIAMALAIMAGTIIGHTLYDMMNQPSRCTMTIYPLPPR